MAAAVALASCGGEYQLDDEPAPSGNPPPQQPLALEPTIESIQDHVFTPRCAYCHAGSAPSGNLALSNAQTSYSNLVGVRASEFPLAFRVSAGNADASYLVRKLEGTQQVGDRMPQGGPYLDQATIDVIRQWIDDGAPPPATKGFGGVLLQSAH
jgi:hypothetical protein